MLQRKIERRKLLRFVGMGVIGIIAVAAASGAGPIPSVLGLFSPAPAAAQVNGRTYQQVVTQEFIPRTNAALNNIRTAMIAAGITANNITITEVDSNDLRYQIIIRRGSQTVTGYIELTDGLHLIGEAGRGQAIFTFWFDRNGIEITTSYAPGPINAYTTPDGLDALLIKLGEVEATIPEAITKIRASVGL